MRPVVHSTFVIVSIGTRRVKLHSLTAGLEKCRSMSWCVGVASANLSYYPDYAVQRSTQHGESLKHTGGAMQQTFYREEAIALAGYLVTGARN